jgi:hypothetical protein
MEYLDKKEARDQASQFKREESQSKRISEQKQLNLKREELASKERIADKQLQIAKENKNKYDTPSKKDKKQK